MEEVEKAESLLKIITKQRFSDSIVKSELVSLGFLTEKGNVDATGKRFVHSYFMDLLRERNELAAQAERLRGALILCVDAAEDTDYGWNGDCGVINKINCIVDSVIEEAPAQSLDAVKREWKAELIEHCYMFSFLIDDISTEQSVDISVIEDFEL